MNLSIRYQDKENLIVIFTRSMEAID